MPELVAERLRLRSAIMGHRRLLPEPVHEPADDRTDRELQPERHDHGLEPEVGRLEVVASPPFDRHEHRDLRDRKEQAAEQAVAKRGLEDREEEKRPDRRRPRLDREDERVGPDDGRVEHEARETDGRLILARHREPAEQEEEQRSGSEAARDGPRRDFVALRGEVADEGDLDEGPRHGDQPDDRDPALQLPASLLRPGSRVTSSSRASAHSACSRRSGSPSRRVGLDRRRAAPGRRRSPRRRARCGAGSADPCAGSRGARTSGAAARRRPPATRPATRAALPRPAEPCPRARFSIPRFHGQTSWQMSHP